MRYEWKKHGKKRTSAFINGGMLVLTGVLLILIYHGGYELTFVLGSLFIIYSIIVIILYLINRYNSFEDTLLSFAGGIITLVIGVMLLVSPGLAGITMEGILSIWLILIGLIYVVDVYTYVRERNVKWIVFLVSAIICLGLGICVLLYVRFGDLLIGSVLSVYLIVLGIFTTAGQFIKKADPHEIALPVPAEAFLPLAVLAKLDTFDEKAHEQAKEVPDTTGDVEIFIDLSKHLSTFFGHVDIAFEDYVFSFGPYDFSKKSRRLFGMVTNGILAICPREEYIDFSIKEEQKTIFGYQISLDEDQKHIFAENTKKFLGYCVPWAPEEKDKNRSRFAWAIQKRGAHLYKVKKHRFKEFSAVGTNCALLVETLLDGTGVPRARSIGGIVVPGAVLSLLDREFYRKGSMVVARNEYAK